MSKAVLGPTRVLDAAAMAAARTSSSIDVTTMDNVAFQASWTANDAANPPVGKLKLQGSIDNTNWSDLASSEDGSVSGASGSVMLTVSQTPVTKIRAVYTPQGDTGSSGDGALTIYALAKCLS